MADLLTNLIIPTAVQTDSSDTVKPAVNIAVDSGSEDFSGIFEQINNRILSAEAVISAEKFVESNINLPQNCVSILSFLDTPDEELNLPPVSLILPDAAVNELPAVSVLPDEMAVKPVFGDIFSEENNEEGGEEDTLTLDVNAVYTVQTLMAGLANIESVVEEKPEILQSIASDDFEPIQGNDNTLVEELAPAVDLFKESSKAAHTGRNLVIPEGFVPQDPSKLSDAQKELISKVHQTVQTKMPETNENYSALNNNSEAAIPQTAESPVKLTKALLELNQTTPAPLLNEKGLQSALQPQAQPQVLTQAQPQEQIVTEETALTSLQTALPEDDIVVLNSSNAQPSSKISTDIKKEEPILNKDTILPSNKHNESNQQNNSMTDGDENNSARENLKLSVNNMSERTNFMNSDKAIVFNKILDGISAPKEIAKTDVLKQVDSMFHQLAKTGSNRVNLVLTPENLGKLSIEIFNTKAGVVASMVAENQQIKELLEKSIEVLKNNMASNGVNVSSVVVKVEQTSQASGGSLNFQNESMGANLSDERASSKEKTFKNDSGNSFIETDDDNQEQLASVETTEANRGGAVNNPAQTIDYRV